MKKIILLCTLSISVVTAFAQKQSFDIVTYTSPKDWKEEPGNGVVGYTFINNQQGTWCQIGVFQSTASKGSMEADFDSEWNGLIAQKYSVTSGPQKENVKEVHGWKTLSGKGKAEFNNAEMTVMLICFSGYDVCVSVVAQTNSDDYLSQVEDFVRSIELKKPDTYNTNQNPSPDNNATVAGIWINGKSVNPVHGDPVSWGSGGYTKSQYVFNADGTYLFYCKSFGYSLTNLILSKEKGTYSINGNNIIISPISSVVESWTKKDGTDKWGKLVSSQKKILEKTTYQFTKHYFSGIQQWNLVLQVGSPTQRDGAFSSNATFSNAYYYAPTSNNNTPIDLPPGLN